MMAAIVALARPLPLPDVSVRGEKIVFKTIDQLGDSLQDARVLCSTALDEIDAAFINMLPSSVGLIANLGVGTDNINLEAANSHGIVISNTPVVTEDTADLAFGLLLATARNIGEQERYVRAGNWPKLGSLNKMGTRVHGKTLGVIGFGAIGQAVARRARGFDMKILYWNRSAKLNAERELRAHRVEDLHNLLAQSDFISIHTPLTEATRHLIGSNELEHCKANAVLINTSRGPVVDESALAAALRSGHLRGAGLDVYENEPEIPDELFALDQVILLPHIGSATVECRAGIISRGIENIMTFLETGQVLDPVNN